MTLSPESKLLERKYLHTQTRAGTPPLKLLSYLHLKISQAASPPPHTQPPIRFTTKSTESQNKHPRINRPPRLAGKLPTIKTDTKTSKLEGKERFRDCKNNPGSRGKISKSNFISLEVRFYTRVLTFCKEEKKRGG